MEATVSVTFVGPLARPEWVADVEGTEEPYDPDSLDHDAVNRALAGWSKAA
ncbi:hypothetical protein J2X01_001841 [Arthrobacter ginsengisoli]|uniref:Uncharacterized protein n=1 Tax=Arthrobacter ginsengisoli TaxID=1356565 RepID=A0ABU1UBH8_9MICC|nr:hypothetical protein [Arthrobacter ginsengisoli]MDR7082552.1 hypothetical protein [Arthrobacter ginsengisoli]